MRVLPGVAIRTLFCCIGIVCSIRKEKFLSTVLSVFPIFLLTISFTKGECPLKLQK